MFVYLNLQNVVWCKTLVVHLMVGVICITTALILDKGKAADDVSQFVISTAVSG